VKKCEMRDFSHHQRNPGPSGLTLTTPGIGLDRAPVRDSETALKRDRASIPGTPRPRVLCSPRWVFSASLPPCAPDEELTPKRYIDSRSPIPVRQVVL
jgi:hypothetical protein